MGTTARWILGLVLLVLMGPLACGFLTDDGGGGGPVEFTVSTGDRAAGQDPDGPVEIRFTRDLDEATVTYDPETGQGTFTVTNTRTGEMVTGTLEIDGDRIIFRPEGGLGNGVVYRVELSEAIASSDGETLGEELALLLSTQALDRVDVEVLHPRQGWAPKLLYDVCYDVDEGAAFDLEYLRWAIENGQTLADNRNLEYEDPRAELYSEPLFTKFHFWPNLINLTEVYYGDEDLYTLLIEEFLEFEPDAAALLASLLDDILAGERVFLARDFVTYVQDAFDTYQEVHYGFLLNLDSEWIREVLVHEFTDLGLPLLHDPHTDEMQEVFDDNALVRQGEVWTICLRGNMNIFKYQGIVVDRLDDTPEFYLRRIHQTCSPGPDDPPEDPLDVVIPPPGPNPPPPGGKGGKGGKGGDQGGGDGGPAGPGNPKAPKEPQRPEGEEAPFPWPWPGPEGEETSEPEDPEKGAGTPQGNPRNCSPQEIQAIQEAAEQVKQTTDQKGQLREQDRETFKATRWRWADGLTFNDPCIQALYDEYKAQIDALQEQVDAAGEAEAATAAEKEESKKDLDPVLNTARIREDIWDNMLTTGGPWSNVRVPCMPPWIPAGGNPFQDPSGDSIIIITVEQQARFQKDIYKGLVRGLSFDEAVNSALANGHNYPPEVVDGDKIYQLIWKTYAECLKKLYEEMAKIYLPLVYPNATEQQIADAWKVMCEGKSVLTTEQQDALTTWQEDYKAACVAEGQQYQSGEDLKGQIEDLRLEFRKRALECFEQSYIDYHKCRTKQWILEDYLTWLGTLAGSNYDYRIGPNFCEVVDEMLAEDLPPCLKAYLQDLKRINCEGENR